MMAFSNLDIWSYGQLLSLFSDMILIDKCHIYIEFKKNGIISSFSAKINGFVPLQIYMLAFLLNSKPILQNIFSLS